MTQARTGIVLDPGSLEDVRAYHALGIREERFGSALAGPPPREGDDGLV